MQRWIFILLFAFVSFKLSANVDKVSTNNVTCRINQEECVDCPYATNDSGSGATTKTIGLIAIIGLGSYYLCSRYKKKLFLVLGGGVIIVLISSSFIRLNYSNDNNCTAIADENGVDEFNPIGEEFETLDKEENIDASLDEFSEAGDEFSEASGEFSEISTDEFSSTLDNKTVDNSTNEGLTDVDKEFLIELLILFLITIIVGLFINHYFFQKLRPFVMLSMLVWLGFIHGGCPCMISSFQNLILASVGVEVNWVSLLWFIGLIPITYFLGRVWCGWLCHLGALQDFVFSATRFEILKSQKHQKILKIIQASVFVLLLLQIAITRTNIYIHYDPFKVAFNLFSATVTGYVLLFILLISSVLIYRPFCRTICPVGLVLGWISLLPKARKVTQDISCIDCVKCSKTCKTGAILYVQKQSVINEANCIACGDCLKSCNKEALHFSPVK